MVNARPIGVLGQLAPAIADARELPAADEIYVAEIDLDALSAASPSETLRATTLPRYPSVVRDISILVNDALSAETVRGTIRSAAPDTLIQVREFDRYQGKGIPDGKVSLSFRLTFQSPERTLTDDEVQAAMQRIIARSRAIFRQCRDRPQKAHRRRRRHRIRWRRTTNKTPDSNPSIGSKRRSSCS